MPRVNRRSRIDWRAVAASLAAALPIGRLDAAVLDWAARQRRSRRLWHVALSGGPDSVALLLLIWAHWPERRRLLRALHFDHRLRGAIAARQDCRFCRTLCTALGVKLIVGRWHRRPERRARSEMPALISEQQARAARMAFLHRHADVLWLGHQQDDIAETMLMRLARGSGTGGLAAPRPVHGVADRRTHLRPLLGIKKTEIVTHLKACGGQWREDASNSTDAYFRNRVRRSVIPVWQEAAGRDAMAGARRSRELLEEDDVALETWLDELKPISRGGELRLPVLTGRPKALARRAVHRWLLAQPTVFSLSRQAVDALVDAAQLGRNTRHSLGHKQFAVIRDGRLKFENRKVRRKFQRRVN